MRLSKSAAVQQRTDFHAPNSTPQTASHVIRILRIVIRLAVEPSWNAFTDAETLTRTQRWRFRQMLWKSELLS